MPEKESSSKKLSSGSSHKNGTSSTGPAASHGQSKDDREIDNFELAALLRECAKFVERGEFDPILYQALQDFRVYYKQKYPKVKRTKSEDVKSHKKKSKRKDAATHSTAETTATTDDNSTVAKEGIEEEHAQEQQEEADHCTTPTDTKEVHFSEDEFENEEISHVVESTLVDSTATDSIPEAAEEFHDETTPTSEQVRPAVAVPVAAEAIPEYNRSTIGPIATAIPVAPPAAAASVTPDPRGSPPSSRPAAAATTTTATKFHVGSAVFGKFHIPKLNVKQAAFAATSKKNAQRAREDLEAFSNELSRQAESSSRRRAPLDGYDVGHPGGGGGGEASEGDYYDDWCDVHFTKNCECRVRASETGETSSSRAGGPAHGASIATSCAATTSAATATAAVPVAEATAGAHEQEQSHHYNNNNNNSDDRSVSSIDGGISSTNSSHKTYDTAGAVHHTGYTPSDETTGSGGGGGSVSGAYSSAMDNKPSFQRPVSKNSALIANGWIEQYRRSKMRFVWKEVLASLVQGTKPGEETTLWIQREIFNPISGRNELEALHQIPVKVLEDVSLKEYTVDHQFTLKIYNSTDEFVFRCSDAPANSMMWVQTLKKYKQIAQGTYRKDEEEKKGSDTSPSNQYQRQGSGISNETQAMNIRELRAICHGAGINTAGMERGQLERAAEEVRRRGTYFDRTGAAAAAPAQGYPHPQQQYAPASASGGPPSIKAQQAPPPAPAAAPAASAVPPPASAPEGPSAETRRLGIKELRAICHGAGINTVGMERSELEAAAEEVQRRGTYFDPPPGMHAPSEEEIRARQEEYRKQEELRARQEELRRRQEQEAEEARRRAAAAAAAAEEERRRVAEEEARRRAAEEARRRVDEEVRRRAAEEHQRRVAAEEQLRRQHEAQARYQQQQAAWRKQQEEEENRRRAAEQQAAEQRRRHEEAMRKQQQWASSQQQHPHHQQQQQQQWNQAYGQQQNAWNQHQQQQPNRNAPPPHQQQQQQHYQQQHHPHSAADEKYAAMANQTQDGGQAAITRIKHGILIHWALQPPQLQMLRPIDALITSIHQVFPPALGVVGHDYFTKWKPVTRTDIVGPSGLPDEEKLKKSVRKIRFFLHPDKLPNDLNEEQQFMTKMLWDVTSDAWEEYQKHKEDLDWVKN
jgi:hypothetical protein